ncbi:MAG: EamA family transporter [Alphaproteobacteria bacterium]
MSWVLYACMAAVILATHQLSMRWMALNFHTTQAGVFYLPMMFGMTLPFAYYAYTQGIKPEITSWGLLACAATAATGVVFGLAYMKAFQLSTSAALVVVIADVGACIVTTFIAYFFLGEAMTLTKAVGIALALVGTAMALRG